VRSRAENEKKIIFKEKPVVSAKVLPMSALQVDACAQRILRYAREVTNMAAKKKKKPEKKKEEW